MTFPNVTEASSTCTTLNTTDLAQPLSLEALNKFKAKHQKLTEFFNNVSFGNCTPHVQELLDKFESCRQQFVQAYQVHHQDLYTRLDVACKAVDCEAINRIFTEIKTEAVTAGKKIALADVYKHHRFNGSVIPFYFYLSRLTQNPDSKLKQIVFLFLHAAALTDRRDEVRLCLDFIFVNGMEEELFTNGDACFVFPGGEKLYFYRAVLALHLQYFQNLLTGGMKEATESEILLTTQNTVTVMKELLEILYGYKKSFSLENLFLYLEEASHMNSPELINAVLEIFYKQVKQNDEIDAEVLIALYNFGREERIVSLPLFVVYWTVYNIVHGAIRPTNEGPIRDLLKLIGDNTPHIGNRQDEAYNNGLPSWLRYSPADIKDEQLAHLFECLPRAISWNLRQYEKITDKAVEYLTDFCKEVQKLDFYGSEKLTDRSLQLIANNLSQLVYLGLSTYNYNKPKFTDEGIILLLKRCTQLRYLVLDPHQEISVFTPKFYNAFQGISLKLEHFHISQPIHSTYEVTIENIVTFLKSCPNMKDVDIEIPYSHRGIMDSRQLLAAIMEYCPNVEKLYLGFNTNMTLTQVELQSLLDMPSLKQINLTLNSEDFDPENLKKPSHLEHFTIYYHVGEYYSYKKS